MVNVKCANVGKVIDQGRCEHGLIIDKIEVFWGILLASAHTPNEVHLGQSYSWLGYLIVKFLIVKELYTTGLVHRLYVLLLCSQASQRAWFYLLPYLLSTIL